MNYKTNVKIMASTTAAWDVFFEEKSDQEKKKGRKTKIEKEANKIQYNRHLLQWNLLLISSIIQS